MTDEEQKELARLREAYAKLTPVVNALGEKVWEMERALKHVSRLFSNAWNRRDKIARRIMVLEKKVQYLKPYKGQNAVSAKKAPNIEAALKKLDKGALRQLIEILKKGEKK